MPVQPGMCHCGKPLHYTKAMSNANRIMICRSGLEPLSPGSELGYKCKLCGHPLQVTSEGIVQLKIHEDLMLVCNPCGFAIHKLLLEKKSEQMVTEVFHTGAQEQMARAGIHVEDFIPDKPIEVASQCPLCDDTHTSLEGSRVDCRCGTSYIAARVRGH